MFSNVCFLTGLPWSMQPCGSGSQVVYAWAGDAPQLDLPEDVGYKGTTHLLHRFKVNSLEGGGQKIEMLNFTPIFNLKGVFEIS